MKEKYPKYSLGELKEIKEKIPIPSKKLLNEFLNNCRINAGEPKVKKIERHLLQLYDITETGLDKQTKDTVNSFLVVLNNSDRSFWTKNEIKIYLKKFLLWHYKNMELVENIKKTNKRIDDAKINSSSLVTPEEFEQMIRNAENYKEKALLLLLWETGARPQEFLEAKWKQVSFKNGYGEINLYSKKTGSSRSFPIKEAVKYLKDWKENFQYSHIKPNDYLFPNPRNRDKCITSASVNKMLRKISRKAKLNKDVWSYLFRHTRANKLYEELPEQVVEKLMGHKGMAGIYAHISNKKAVEEMLNKIYKVEEVSGKKQKQLEKEISELKKSHSNLKEMFDTIYKKLQKHKDLPDIEIITK